MKENHQIVVKENRESLAPLAHFGGTGPGKALLLVNRRYYTVNDIPHIPIMGEFHFSRWPAAEWRESLERMRAGGIEIVASYVFWIHHEEEKGIWDFSGSRNLRAFISLCHELDFPLLLRIGPWSHGECRNGGFPDWLADDRNINTRTNDAVYLALAKSFYEQIYNQTQGFLWQDGGPVLGIQLENEHGHVGGPTGPEGLAHIQALKKIACETGFRVPFYTATGWGGANVVADETLPVLGGYCDAPWERHTASLPANENYLISGYPPDSYTYDTGAYPFATAELGGGIQVTGHRRPVLSSADAEAMMVCKLGAGANLLGYYMYHGGTNPDGKLTALNEIIGRPHTNDLPEKSYDFQAPIRESGELGDNYRALKRLHLFLHDFGHLLAQAELSLPDIVVADAEDTESLRMSVRYNSAEKCGFLFLNNHQRHRLMSGHDDLSIQVSVGEEKYVFAKLTIKNGDYFIFPFHLRLGEAVLKTANAQPLCQIGRRTFFFSDAAPAFAWEGDAADVVILSNHDSLHAWKFGDYLYITEGDLRQHNGKLLLRSDQLNVKVKRYGETGDAAEKMIYFPEAAAVDVHVKEEEALKEYKKYTLAFSEFPGDAAHDAILQIDFIGDKAELFQEGRLIADWFTTGLPWRTALKRHGYGRKYTLKVYRSVNGVFYDEPVLPGCALQAITVHYLYEQPVLF